MLQIWWTLEWDPWTEFSVIRWHRRGICPAWADCTYAYLTSAEALDVLDAETHCALRGDFLGA